MSLHISLGLDLKVHFLLNLLIFQKKYLLSLPFFSFNEQYSFNSKIDVFRIDRTSELQAQIVNKWCIDIFICMSFRYQIQMFKIEFLTYTHKDLPHTHTCRVSHLPMICIHVTPVYPIPDTKNSNIHQRSMWSHLRVCLSTIYITDIYIHAYIIFYFIRYHLCLSYVKQSTERKGRKPFYFLHAYFL